MSGMEEIILVDETDKEIGFEEKIKAHSNGGKLHRAFSIFILNSGGKLLLQLRSVKKHHFGGLWTNTCCSHPRKGEKLEVAIHRKLLQEFGFDTELRESFSFTYRADDAKSGLTEHEFDHVFMGLFNGKPKPNPEEIDDWKWVDLEDLKRDVTRNPGKYTPWFKLALDKVIEHRPKAQF